MPPSVVQAAVWISEVERCQFGTRQNVIVAQTNGIGIWEEVAAMVNCSFHLVLVGVVSDFPLGP